MQRRPLHAVSDSVGKRAEKQKDTLRKNTMLYTVYTSANKCLKTFLHFELISLISASNLDIFCVRTVQCCFISLQIRPLSSWRRLTAITLSNTFLLVRNGANSEIRLTKESLYTVPAHKNNDIDLPYRIVLFNFVPGQGLQDCLIIAGRCVWLGLELNSAGCGTLGT